MALLVKSIPTFLMHVFAPVLGVCLAAWFVVLLVSVISGKRHSCRFTSALSGSGESAASPRRGLGKAVWVGLFALAVTCTSLIGKSPNGTNGVQNLPPRPMLQLPAPTPTAILDYPRTVTETRAASGAPLAFATNGAISVRRDYVVLGVDIDTPGRTAASLNSLNPLFGIPATVCTNASHWGELFPSGDGRRLLTWKGRFLNVTNIVNFYSSQDEVVCNGDGRPKDIDREYAWYTQETCKGEWTWMMQHPNEGGWAFNRFYDTITHPIPGMPSHEVRVHMDPDEANNLSSSGLQQDPFFLDFASSQMHSSSNGTVVADNYLYRADMLAYAIPAESYAVGANPLPQLVGRNKNFNMAEFTEGQGDLPENGDKSDEQYQNWQHSTFVQRSYKRTRELYNAIMQFIKTGDD